MEFRVGNKVKFLNDIGGGIIKTIVDKNMVKIEDEDGFEIPVLKSELLLDEAVNEKSFSKEIEPFTPETIQESQNETHIQSLDEILPTAHDARFFLAFVPVNKKRIFNGSFGLYLINDSDYNAYYTTGLIKDVEGNLVNALGHGSIEADTKIKLSDLQWDVIKDYDSLMVQLLLFAGVTYTFQTPIDRTFDFQMIKNNDELYFAENDFFDEKAMIFPLLERFDEQMIQISEKEKRKILYEKNDLVLPKKVEVKFDSEELVEIDLHIHEIMDNHAGMSNGELLKTQLAYFKEKLDELLSTKVKKAVFIHGVGNGRLKFDVHQMLDNKYPLVKYQDASFREYGYGATMVFLRK